MKCLVCESLSLLHICKSCQEKFLTPNIYKRKLTQDIDVISFYKYSDIKDFLHTKHTDLGYYTYKTLAQNSFEKFAKEFVFDTKVVSIAIDDNIKNGYSHTAILNKALTCRAIKPLFNKLRATNEISYSGKSREFRMMNPRNFKMKNFKEDGVILVDDIITTGSTLNQALKVLKSNKKDVLFCLTLADASLK